jgi:hypothetical protein
MDASSCSLRSTDVVKYLLPVLLALASACAPAEKRVDIVLRNDAARPIELRASAGLFSRRLQLMPGEVWRGWVPLDFAIGEIRLEVAEDPRFLPTK